MTRLIVDRLTCTKCGKTKLLRYFSQRVQSGRPHSWCRFCRADHQRNYRIAQLAVVTSTSRDLCGND